MDEEDPPLPCSDNRDPTDRDVRSRPATRLPSAVLVATVSNVHATIRSTQPNPVDNTVRVYYRLLSSPRDSKIGATPPLFDRPSSSRVQLERKKERKVSFLRFFSTFLSFSFSLSLCLSFCLIFSPPHFSFNLVK